MLTLQLVQLFRVIVGRQAEDGATDELWYNPFSQDESIRETVRCCSPLVRRTDEVQRERDGPSSLGLPSLELLHGTFRWLQ